MTPYYQADGITIYRGDCRDVLPQLAGRFLLLTDPPYGIGYNREPDPQVKHRAHPGRQLGPVAGDEEPFDPSHLPLDGPFIVWGANNFARRMPECPVWLVWDKVTRNGLDVRIAEAELAATNCVQRSRVFRFMWSGAYRDDERGIYVHPTQKPVALMKWCLTLPGVPDNRVILDPYMGSGPVLRAAKDLQREAVGIEREERYCEIAVQRLQQQVLELEG